MPLRSPLTLLLLLIPALAVGDGYILGAGLQADDADGAGATLFGDFSIGERTWLSTAVGRNTVELPSGTESETLYADIGVDRRFDDVGMRLTVAYRGDSDLLDSLDLRGTLYARGENGSLDFEVEYRDFEFELPPLDFLPRTTFPFHAIGVGVTGSVNVGDNLDFYLGAKHYDYSVPFRRQESDRLRPLLALSRLSVFSSLVDWRMSAGVGIDAGNQRWSLDLAAWHGAIDNSDNESITLSFLTPLTSRIDVEFGIGQDRSNLYGDVTVASLLLFVYGGH
ncbi:MAG: hypothetical protein R3315_08310 [Woeseiaceae bacterium]|nr:hypothetical protein [Woeseiaceae bacterium]